MPNRLQELRRLPKAAWGTYLTHLTEDEKEQLLSSLRTAQIAQRYSEDPVAYVNAELEETVWSLQVEMLEAVRDHERVAIPACHSPGKSHIAARLVIWWILSHPIGTAQAVTTATTFRQVRNILWPHIRRLHDRHDLPGRTNMVEWFVGDELCAYGFSSADTDPEAVQGIHSPNLLILVDEAAGISHALGQALESLLSSGHVRIVLLGNPPVDQEGTWFEACCESERWYTVHLPAQKTPNWTGETTDWCRACPPEVPPHEIATHLITKEWAQGIADDYGEDSPMYLAKVLALFPKGVMAKAIPFSFVEGCINNEYPWGGTSVRLGVDVASDGGDEVVVAKAVGWTVTIEYAKSGDANANPVDVAGEVLRQIRAAEIENAKLGNESPVRVKIDTVGLGWGVAGTLERWGEEGKHRSEIVPVKAGEKAQETDKFANVRAEMWWNGRTLLAPLKDDQGHPLNPRVKLKMDRRSSAQLTIPKYKTDSAGRIQIERKTEMKSRGLSSPDRAEAVLMAIYEPPPEEKPRKARFIF